MKKKKKIFDAVFESRCWRAQTSQVLDAMTCAERIAFLETLSPGARGPECLPTQTEIPPTLVVRDETP